MHLIMDTFGKHFGDRIRCRALIWHGYESAARRVVIPHASWQHDESPTGRPAVLDGSGSATARTAAAAIAALDEASASGVAARRATALATAPAAGRPQQPQLLPLH